MRGCSSRPRIRQRAGFLLIEFLAAMSVSGLLMSVLAVGFASCYRAGRTAEHHFQKYRDLRPFLASLERELRNSVSYERYPFRGNSREMKFPVRECAAEGWILKKIRFCLSSNHPRRESRPLKEALADPGQAVKVFALEVKTLRFEYPYADQGGQIRYLPFWLEEPYQGLPAAVRVIVKASSGGERFDFVKLIDIPQGKLGALPDTGYEPLSA